MAYVPNRIDRDITFEDFTAGVQLLDAVFEKSDGTVDRANASSLSTSPAIGFVVALDTPTSGTAKIQYDGRLSGFSGLVQGATYFLDLTDGQITDDVSTHTFGDVIQKVGVALDSTTILIQIDRDFTELVA